MASNSKPFTNSLVLLSIQILFRQLTINMLF
jgi:hypothetical protein